MTMRNAARLVCIGLLFIGLLAGTLVSSAPAEQYDTFLPLITRQRPPNFIIIVSDDQRYDMMDYMPLTQTRLFDQGLTFDHAYISTPLCCPSRASILTGMYAHSHFVYDNYAPLHAQTFVQRLHDLGYYTGIVGKYLNSWDGTYRPEFDQWAVFAGHGAAQQYYDPSLNINGTWSTHFGYITHILRDYALSFLNQAQQQQRPFLFIFAPNAPHEPGYPAPGDQDLYPNLPLHRPLSFMEADMSDKPIYLQARPPANPPYLDELRRQQLQSLHALDLAIDDLLNAVDSYGLTDDTVIMFISDNGIFWGEHTLDGKLYPYDEATHVPFAIKYDRLIGAARVDAHLVSNIDIAPTLYELAGLPIPPEVDGVSLMPLLTQEAVTWRDAVLIEGWGYRNYAALRTERYLYVETENDTSELYDSLSDPYQIDSQHNNAAYAGIIADLHGRLQVQLAGVQPAPAARYIYFLISALGLDD